MYAKIEITGTMEVITGLHIGGYSAFSAIGAVDSPVIRDVWTNLPLVPGSSLKGKLRTLLARRYNTVLAKGPDEDAECIRRLFGSANPARAGKLLFTDMVMSNGEEMRERGLTGKTEIKAENSIGRLTARANPRQIERVISGACFPLSLLYECTEEGCLEEDFQLIAEGLKLLEYDYLGGHGSRGYGRVRFCGLQAAAVAGKIPQNMVEACNQILRG